MTLTDKAIRQCVVSGERFLGEVDAESFRRHAQDPGVLNLIQEAREAWHESEGYDPAACRQAG